MVRRSMSRRVLVMSMALLSLGAFSGCSKPDNGATKPGDAPGATPSAKTKTAALTVSKEQHASWIRNFNPLLEQSNTRWPSPAGIYEPMLIFNTMKGEFVPWLAEKYEWSDGNKKLTFALRDGVKWSDGQPFTAKDVAFTFGLTKKHKALDLHEVWGFTEDVQAKDDKTVEFTLKRAYVPGLLYIAHQPIVPEHKWKDVADPVTYKNENPVATGPFTEVKVFQNQIYELGRNPNYWQKGKPAVEALRFPAYPGNDQANLALINGEVDWAGNFVPEVERVYVGKDKEHNHYWFPLNVGTVMLYANTSKKPFDDVRVRKAISMAIDREQIVKVAMQGYSRPSDATALSDAYEKWRNPKAIEAGDWVKLDLAKANALLDEAGFKKGEDGVRKGPDGTPLTYDVNVVTGWSDWVRAVQIITTNLKQIGVQATLRSYDFGAWFEKIQKGEFDLSIGWSSEEPTPYNLYRDLMGSFTYRPVGEMAARNWHRFKSEKADQLFQAFEATADAAEQKRLADEMQVLFVETAPVIPLFPAPSWGEFSTKRFTGFPSKENPYAKLSPNTPPEYLLVLTELKPK